MIAPLSLVKAILSCSIVFFFEKISFKNLAYRGIRDKASAKGILMQIFLSILTNLLNCEGEKNHKKGGLNCVFGNFFFYVLDNCPQVQSLK